MTEESGFNHPPRRSIPMALIGAGLGWLAVEQLFRRGAGRPEIQRAAARVEKARQRVEQRSEEQLRRTRLSFWSRMDQSPLAVGAMLFAVGAAAGLGFPSSEWEDERLGPVRDQVKEKVKRQAREAGHRALERQDVAQGDLANHIRSGASG